MSYKDKVADPVTERFELSFSAVGWSQDGKKIVLPEHRVAWHPAKPRQKPKKKAG
ncbi:MAG: hypothetical protein ICCCNLDF_02628 [Planctomycetes bacterium]|nr:hypothetical protein [Planctomycetota bacterium]